jgi:hypothetical protein
MSEHIITADHQKWRYRCLAPDRYDIDEGHSNWFPINGVFRCWSCAEQARTNPEVDPEYALLRDTRTGELVARQDIILDVHTDPSTQHV